MSSISELIKNNNSITHLDLSNTLLDTDALLKLSEGCSNNQGSLKVLILNSIFSENSNISDFFMSMVNSKIEEINLINNEFSGEFGTSLGEFIKKCKTLKIFKISSKSELYKTSDNNMIILGANENSNLKKIFIENIKVDSEIFEDFFRNNIGLTEFTMRNSEKNCRFIQYLSNCQNLEKIDLNIHECDEKQAINLQHLIRKIKYAKIHINSLTKETAEILIEGLKNNLVVEYFEIFQEESLSIEFEKAILNYYSYVITCCKLANIQIVHILESSEIIRKEKKIIAFKKFEDFFRNSFT